MTEVATLNPDRVSLSSDYEELYADLLQSIGEWSPRRSALRSAPLTALWPTAGDRFLPRRSLLVIGRATNGYGQRLTADDLVVSSDRDRVIAEARAIAEGANGQVPLNWMWNHGPSNGGTTATRSPFWRVSRALLSMIVPEAASQQDWGRYISWSNVAKVAPRDRGNPPWSLLKLQLPYAAALIQKEAEELNPAVVLIVAGKSWWVHVENALNFRLGSMPDCEYVHSAGRHQERIWICSERPESRPESAFIDELRHVAYELGVRASLGAAGSAS